MKIVSDFLIKNLAPLSTPAAGAINLFSKLLSGRSMLMARASAGADTALQAFIGRNKIASWLPTGNGSSVTTLGGTTLSATGTATSASVATTNRHTWMRRLEYLVTTAATTAVAGFRAASLQWGRGSSPGDGGFHMVCRWGPATGVATTTNRAFAGMIGSTSAPADVNPSTQINIIGMGWDDTDTNIQMMVNDGTGTATKVDLGASFPVPTADRTKVYEVSIFCAPNDTSISWEVTDLATAAVATGSAPTDIPANTQLLMPSVWMSVGGTSSVIGVALMSLYVETDY